MFMNPIRGKFIVACLFVVITQFGASVQTGYGQSRRLDQSPIPTNSQLSRYGLELKWWGQSTLNPKRDKVRYVTVDEMGVFVQADSGVISAFDAENGRKLWALLVGRMDQASFPVTANDESLLVVAGLSMFAVDRFDGERFWELQLPKYPSTSPEIDDEQLYFGTLDGSVYAYDIRKIRELYEQRKLPKWSQESRVWRYKTAQEITSKPISNGRTVDFASRDGSLYSIGTTSRNLIFQFETDKPVSAPITTNGKYIFLASEDFTFYCLDGKNGKVRWSFVTGKPIKKAPYAIDNHVFLTPEDGGMFCINADTGKGVWPQPVLQADHFIAASPDIVYAGDQGGNMLLIDRKTGQVIGIMPLQRFTIHPVNYKTDRIVLSTQSGLVICLQESGREFPIYYQNPDRRPLIPLFESDEPEDSNPPEPTP